MKIEFKQGQKNKRKNKSILSLLVQKSLSFSPYEKKQKLHLNCVLVRQPLCQFFYSKYVGYWDIVLLDLLDHFSLLPG